MSSDSSSPRESEPPKPPRRPWIPLRRKITLTFLSGLTVLLLINLARSPYYRPIFTAEYWQTLGKFGQVLRIIHSDYVEQDGADFDDLNAEAMQAMVASLDKHSRYYSPERYEDYKKFNRMEYVGIGVQVQEIKKRIYIIDVFRTGSASEVGILPGDQIVAVDDRNIENLSLLEVVDLIKGPKGTTVKIRILRSYPEQETQEYTVERRDIIRDSVNNVQMLPPDVGYLQIAKFTDNTPYLLSESLDQLYKQGAESLIIDLRGNPGGLLPVCVDVASEFLPDNKIVLTVRSRREDQKQEYKAKEDNREFKLPIMILQDKISASASEILAGCLKVYGLAKIVGTQSHGKGTVQTVYNLKGEAGLVITTAKYYLPNGQTIAGKGVEPDFIVPFPQEDAAIIYLSLLHRAKMNAEQFQQTFGVSPINDPQLDAALHILKHGSLDTSSGVESETTITSSISLTSGSVPVGNSESISE